jgi:5-formyltetrahydrofolate cyclo-ligase
MTKISPNPRQQLRKKFRDIRNHLPTQAKADASAAICKHLQIFFQQNTANSRQKPIRRIAAYLNSTHEASLDAWITEAWQQTGNKIFVPVVENTDTREVDSAADKKADNEARRGRMRFHRYGNNTQTIVGHYGLRTLAHPESCEQISAADLNCVLLPLVAFDNFGTRLGMGGGYYDRFFANERNRPYLLGISFDAQQSSETLEKSDWDVGLNAVVTESGITEFAGAI